VPWLIAIVVAVISSIAIVYVAVFALSDRPEQGLEVVNRTEEVIFIYQISPDGTQGLQAKVDPGQSVVTAIECGAVPLIARQRDSAVVAKRGPFEECNMADWVIETAH
jgi:hypothetical protein